jgi:hypothetical protein
MGSLFSGKQKSTTTQNQTWGPTQYVADAYKGLIGQAQNVAKTPYNPATNTQVAGFTQPQYQGFGAVQANQGTYQPYMDKAGGLADIGSAGITGDQISQFMNPYTSQVIDASMNDWARMADRRMTDVNSNASKIGALTGDRSQVAQALAREASDTEMASGIAGLRNQGWQSALGAAQADANRALQGAQVQGSLGGLAQQYGYNDAEALMGIGKMQQDQKQKVLDAGTANAKQQSGYDFEKTQWLANLLQGIGSQAGGTSEGTGTSTQKESGNWLGKAVGLGATLFGMSDERVKRDIQEIGATHDGQPIYSYRFAGSPKTEIGLMAQEVEQRHPEAVAEIGGLKHVNYAAATADAARHAYADGGEVGGLRNLSYVPASSMRPGQAMQPPQMAAPQMKESSDGGMSKLLDGFKQAKSAIADDSSGGIGSMMRTSTDPASGWSTTVNPSGTSGWGNYLSNGIGSGLSGLGSLFGFADGGAVKDEYDPFVQFGDMAPQGPSAPAQAGLSGLGASSPVPASASPAAKVEAYKHMLWDNGLSEDASNALIMAGLGMIGGGGRDAFEDIGRGGLAGMQYYTQAQRQHKADSEKKAQEAQGKLMEVNGRLVRVMPDGSASVVYDGAAEQGKLMEANGKIIRVPQSGPAQLVYDAGGKKEGQTPEERAQLAAQYGIDPNSDAGKAFILTGKLPREDQQLLTATDKKAILEADDKLSKNKAVISSLDEAIKINNPAAGEPKPYEGATAGARTWLGNNVWDYAMPDMLASPDRAAATSNLDNAVIASALTQLKEVFGGNPTEGERAILLDLQGASNKPAKVRADIFNRAKAMAQKRLEFNTREAEQLRGGTFYKPGGGMTSSEGAQPAPSGFGGTPVRAKNAQGQVIEFNGKEWVPVQ